MSEQPKVIGLPQCAQPEQLMRQGQWRRKESLGKELMEKVKELMQDVERKL